MAHSPHQGKGPISPFLNVFKDEQLVDSFCLDSRDSFVLGRHTNCDVLLAHPSISRHHLEIQLLHATREIFLTDMDSVHGTWIDGKQIPSLIPCTAKEGTSIKLGASSRTYKVQWLHHPMPVSVNERSMTPDAVGSNISNSGTLLSANVSSSKSTDPCMEGWQNDLPLQPARKHDTCSKNNKTGYDVQIEDCSLPCKQEAKSPYLENEVTAQKCSANIVEANTVLETWAKEQQKGGLPPLPPSRRTPFAPLPQNAASPTIQRKSKPVEKKITNGGKKIDVDCLDELKKQGDENVLAGSRLWLRRCNSAPSPVLNTSDSAHQLPNPPRDKPPSTSLHRKRQEKPGSLHQQESLVMKSVQDNMNKERSPISKITYINQQDTRKEERAQELCTFVVLANKGPNGGADKQEADQILSCSSLEEAPVDDEYPSDKENQEPVLYMGKQLKGGKTSSIHRKPLRPLIMMSHGVSKLASPCSSYSSDRGDESFLSRDRSKQSSVVQNLDYMLQKLKGMAQLEPHYAWHMVVDTNCLLDPKTFKSLKLLEGIKEVRIIVPQIVIRELDFSNRKDKTCVSPNTILKWIETCMVKHPSWIHVQNSSENLPVGASTPPASPHHGPSACAGTYGDLMSPTNGDHVLNCALVFSTTIFDGQVALLTNNTALKIKAMAEGIVCDSATSFCESLLSPYSERFLWAGSVAHHGLLQQKNHHSGVLGSKNTETIAEPNRRTSFIFMSASARGGMASKKKHHVVENLKNHCEHAQGLKVILS